MEHSRPPSQKLPVGLAGVLNGPEDNRDSAYFSSVDFASKHNSAASCLGVNVVSPTGSSFHPSPADHTPSPTGNLGPQSLISPANSHMSVASMVSPTTPASADPRRLDRPQSLETGPNSATFMGHSDVPEALSRRESVDSRINQGFGDMRLGNSPYGSHHPSTTSIHQTLQQQRNPRPNLENLSVHRISNGYQPSAERTPDGHFKTRTAPAITGPAISQIARAAEPTKGQAWAFPEEEIHRMSNGAPGSLIDSRRSSVADSLASSQFTTESRLPPGQRRLDDTLAATDYHRLSSASGEYSTVHHHSLQHKQIGDLRNEEVGSLSGSQPYSRTPELRVSHKLAERKRRTEMKELFEQLRDMMPQERGSKASKWEILTKAIAEHQRMNDTIKYWTNQTHMAQQEIEHVRRERDALRMENQQLRAASMNGQQQRIPSQVVVTDAYSSDQFGRAPPRPELPPLRSLQNGGPGPSAPDSMTGVQYDHPHANSYRPAEQRY